MEPLTLNRYAYTGNNPVMNIDLSGHKNQPLLKMGLKGSSVEKAQQILKNLGYSLGTSGVDGIFGRKTEMAVKDFQADNGLTVIIKMAAEIDGSR